MNLKSVAVLGTASDVGKSVVATALCRILADLGCVTAPFKAQNMSNNSGVAPGIGEMGRAQIVQAQAAGVAPHPDMNPILLKPSTDKGAQVVVHGRVLGHKTAREYFSDTSVLAAEAFKALHRLHGRYPTLVVEGAGSCAEVNLRPRDFVNFETAHQLDCPVILVADIDRGGVFAQVVGTLAVLPPADRARVKGLIINRFRGDASLFEDGVAWLERQTSLPVLGVIPYFRDIWIEWEDALPPDLKLDDRRALKGDTLNIAVITPAHLSNFTDAAPLLREPSLDVRFLTQARDLDGFDLVVLPGSKNVRYDMDQLRERGWCGPIQDFAEAGGRVLGICGGYQMLGRTIADPNGVEGEPGVTDGLSLIPAVTVLETEKRLSLSQGCYGPLDLPIRGYEIHMGRTDLDAGSAALISVTSRDQTPLVGEDGYVSADGRIQGTYFHGLFEDAAFRNAFLRGLKPSFQPRFLEDEVAFRDHQYGLLADHFRANLDMPRLMEILRAD